MARCLALVAAALQWRSAGAGLTSFAKDPLDEGVTRLQRHAFIPMRFLEADDGSCSSTTGPHCRSLSGPPRGAVFPAGMFSAFGPLPGNPGYFVQDDVAAFFAPRLSDDAEGAARGEAPTSHDSLEASPELAARSYRIEWARLLAPQVKKMPQRVRLGQDLHLTVRGVAAVVTTEAREVVGDSVVAPAAHIELQDAIVEFEFSHPVVVEQLVLTMDAPAKPHGPSPAPIVIRGRMGNEEFWNAHIRAADVASGWVALSSIIPLPVNTFVVLGGQGLRIGSIHISRPGMNMAPDASFWRRMGWILTPREQMSSLQDLHMAKLLLPSLSTAVTLSDLHRHGHLRVKRALFADDAFEWEEPVEAEDDHGVADIDWEEQEGIPSERASARGNEDGDFDSRTLRGLRAMLRALQTGAFPFPRDVSIGALEADVQVYSETFGDVTLEELANARGIDELYERLFMTSSMDAIDLLVTRFLWANHTRALRAPGGIVGGKPANQSSATEDEEDLPNTELEEDVVNAAPAPPPGAASPLLERSRFGKRRRIFLKRMKQVTARFAQWRDPIEHKLAFMNSTGAAEVIITLGEGRHRISLEYYNAASGRGTKAEFDVPDSEYLLGQLLGIEGEMLVDKRGAPLDKATAERAHRERSSLEALGDVLRRLQRETSEPAALDTVRPPGPDDADDDEADDDGGAPSPALALGVAALVVGVVVVVAYAPELPPWQRRRGTASGAEVEAASPPASADGAVHEADGGTPAMR